MMSNIFSHARWLFLFLENVYSDILIILKLACLTLECKDSLHILDPSPLSDVCIIDRHFLLFCESPFCFQPWKTARRWPSVPTVPPLWGALPGRTPAEGTPGLLSPEVGSALCDRSVSLPRTPPLPRWGAQQAPLNAGTWRTRRACSQGHPPLSLPSEVVCLPQKLFYSLHSPSARLAVSSILGWLSWLATQKISYKLFMNRTFWVLLPQEGTPILSHTWWGIWGDVCWEA